MKIVFAAILALAAAQTRPKIAEDFIAFVDVERHTYEGDVLGDGYIAHDQTRRRAVERYDLKPEEYHVLHVLNLERADLRKDFEINSEDRHACVVRDHSSSLRAPFAWVANATYVGQIKHREVTLDAWESRIGGVRLRMAVADQDTTRPVVFERESAQSLEKFFFREYNATSPDAKYFEIPEECQSQQALKAPARPQVPATFEAATQVEIHESTSRVLYGEGYFAHDQPAQKAAERYEVEEDKYKIIHLLDIQRGDIHKSYSLNSRDRHQCREHDLTQPLYPPFDWVKEADYVGATKHHERTLDAWEYRGAGVRLLLAVGAEDVNRPVLLERESGGYLNRYYFREFEAKTPDSRIFEVPDECPQHPNNTRV